MNILSLLLNLLNMYKVLEYLFAENTVSFWSCHKITYYNAKHIVCVGNVLLAIIYVNTVIE